MTDELNPMKRQIFPVYYPGEGPFLDKGNPSALTGDEADVEIEISNNPFMCTGIRIRNVYEIPVELRTINLLTYLARLDQEQTIRTDLTQQNVIVRAMSQALLQGGNDRSGTVTHYHPFESPYPFRGGNNINLKFKRETDYPPEITSVIVKATLTGWLYMSDAVPAAGPPSGGFP